MPHQTGNPLKTWFKLMFAQAAAELVHEQNMSVRRRNHVKKRVDGIKGSLSKEK